MKKRLIILLFISMVLMGCSQETSQYEIALVSDAGNINDKSFNQSAWEATEKYANENSKTHKFYKPAQFDTAGYSDSIDEAIANGASVVITPGHKFQEAVDVKQKEYPDVKFILIDAVPASGNISNNVFCALYSEQEVGYLAGYAVVKDGYTKLGFMGGMALPAVVRYGYGYIQGARDAATELSKKIDIKYHCTGSFNESPEIKTLASTWYQDGTEVIFACGGAISNSIFAAANEVDAKTIGVDRDQKDDSLSVITSATKGVYNTVYDQLDKIYKGEFIGGISETLTTKGNYVGLSEDFSRFKQFTKEEYSIVFDKIKNKEIFIEDDIQIGEDPSVLNNDFMTINYIK